MKCLCHPLTVGILAGLVVVSNVQIGIERMRITRLQKQLSTSEERYRIYWEKMEGTNRPMAVMHEFPETLGKMLTTAPDPNTSNILQVLEIVKRLEARVFIQFQQPQPYYWNYTTNDLLGFSNWQRRFNQ